MVSVCTLTGKNIRSLFQAWPAVVRTPTPLVNSCPYTVPEYKTKNEDNHTSAMQGRTLLIQEFNTKQVMADRDGAPATSLGLIHALLLVYVGLLLMRSGERLAACNHFSWRGKRSLAVGLQKKGVWVLEVWREREASR